jgi:hypothetical protein
MHALRRVAFAASRQSPLRAAPRSASWQPVARLYSSEAAAATPAAEQKPAETSAAALKPSESAPDGSKPSAAAPAGQSKPEKNSQSDDLTAEEEKRMNKAVNSSLSRYQRSGYNKAKSSHGLTKPAPKPTTSQTPGSGSITSQKTPPVTQADSAQAETYTPDTKARPTYISLDPVPKRDVEYSASIDWDKSYFGASSRPVSKEQYASLTDPIDVNDVEVKPDGVIYLPEIKYRRKLNDVFGPMGWALIPRGEPVVGENIVTREYALLAGGR